MNGLPFLGTEPDNSQPHCVLTAAEGKQLQAFLPDIYGIDVQPYVIPIPSRCADVLLLGNELNDDRDDSDIKASTQDTLSK